MFRFLTINIFLFLLASALEARNQIDSLKSLLKENQTDSLTVQIYGELSWFYKNSLSDNDSSLYFAVKSLEVANQTSNQQIKVLAYNTIGNAFQAMTQYDSAIRYLGYALEIKSLSKDSLGLSNIYNNLGIVYDEMGSYDRALKHYFKGLKIAEHLNQLALQAHLLNNIGIVYKKQKEYEKVLSYYQRTLAIYQKLSNEFGITVSDGNIGSILIKLGEYEQSIEYLLRAKAGYEKLGYQRYVPYTLSNLAIAYDSLDQTVTARPLYESAYQLHVKNENLYEAAYCAKNLASFYLRQGELTQAKELANRSVFLAKKANAREMLQDAYQVTSQICYQQGYFKEGYQYQNRYIQLKDSLFEDNKTKTIFELQTQYETEKKEQQIAAQQIQLSEEKAINQRNFILILALISSLLLTLVIVVLYRSRTRKKQQIRWQEKDIEFKALQLSAVINSQENERKRFATDLHDGFGQMISILKMNIESLRGKNSSPEERISIFNASKEMLDEMYDELRGICFNLMPQTLVKKGLIDALHEFASRINVAGKVNVDIMHFDMDQRLDQLLEVSLYRIVQEWVNNILKYSTATTITVQLTKDEYEITLTVEDNGLGFDKNLLIESKGNGWKNMKSRTNLIKGEMELDTQPSLSGNTLILNAPAILAAEPIRDSTDIKLQS